MLEYATPIEFQRATTSGRTRPSLLACETGMGEIVEVIAKFSASCDQGVTNLACEAIAACLAADLGLPVPKPFLLTIDPDWAASVTDAEIRAKIQASAPVAFGSTLAGAGFSEWQRGSLLHPGMEATALGVLVFDAIIQNPDRRVSNPNCLVRGKELRIFDHELAFGHRLILGWRPPWVPGGLRPFEDPGFHIFCTKLKTENLDFRPVKESWRRITDLQIADYAQAIPSAWAASAPTVTAAQKLVREARDNIDACLVEIQRVLR